MINPLRILLRFPFSILIGMGLGALLMSWLAPPYLSYQNLPFPVLLERVRPGEVVPLIVARCSTASAEKTYELTRELRSMTDPRAPAIVIGATTLSVPPGCRTTLNEAHTVPSNTPPGTYRIHGVAILPGIVRTHYVPWVSRPFVVTQ